MRIQHHETSFMKNAKGTSLDGKHKRRKRPTKTNPKQENGNRNIHFSNHLECKWIKGSNQKTETGWMDTKNKTLGTSLVSQWLRIHLPGASLVAQWLRICLPMQGTRVQALVWEDPTCRGATRPVSHNCWACASGACAMQRERPRQWEARTPQWRVAPTCRN